MDLIFETQRGRIFFMEVGYFDSVLEIKEKIQKYHGFTVSKQTLFFNGELLQDDLNVHYSEIVQYSRIQLIVANEAKKIQLKIRIPTSEMHVPLEMDDNDTIGRLKENIQEMNKAVPINRLVIYSSDTELQDHRSLCDYELSDNSVINVFYIPAPSTASAGSKMLELTVLSRCGTMKIPVEVDANDNVEVLRKQLERFQRTLKFPLPPEGNYFFIHKQAVMNDDKSFRWHNVVEDDTIEVFNGSITRSD